MNIKLDMPTGKYREFTKEELLELNGLLENSSKTFDSLSSLLSISTVTSAPNAIFVKNILINIINELVNLLYLVIAVIYSFKVNKQ